MNKYTWAKQLKSYIGQQRLSHPIPDREVLIAEEEMQCRIIGGGFINWYQMRLGSIMNERSVLRIEQFSLTPTIVLTTSAPGLAAAQEIFESQGDNPLYLLPEEFEAWEGYGADEKFQWHIHHWNYFESAQGELLEKARQAYPYASAENFRLHVMGDSWGRACGIEAKHLWRWDGDEVELLEEAFVGSIF